MTKPSSHFRGLSPGATGSASAKTETQNGRIQSGARDSLQPIIPFGQPDQPAAARSSPTITLAEPVAPSVIAPRSRRRCGLSLIEVVASTMIVGMMAVAALNSLGAATKSSQSIGNRAIALGLADELMAEILQAAYADPNQTPVFGRETGETAGLRTSFDDVDDYDGYNQSPPKYRDGTTMPDRANWRHRVRVRRVLPADPTQNSGTDQGAKRIDVEIEYNNEVAASQSAVRTNME
jgi:type II secretory pathway pseudopilin PulG